jgi:hypothetical protein
MLTLIFVRDRPVVQLFQARSNQFAFRNGAAAVGFDAPRAALDSTDRAEPNEQEIANRFCLSEQTVKNHLHRMKHKVGADNRLGIVQSCHTQGFLL